MNVTASCQKSATTPKVSQRELGALNPGSPQDGGPTLGSLSAPTLTKPLYRPKRRGRGPLLTTLPGEGEPEEERAADHWKPWARKETPCPPGLAVPAS